MKYSCPLPSDSCNPWLVGMHDWSPYRNRFIQTYAHTHTHRKSQAKLEAYLMY